MICRLKRWSVSSRSPSRSNSCAGTSTISNAASPVIPNAVDQDQVPSPEMPSSSRILDAETAADRPRGYEDAAGRGCGAAFPPESFQDGDRVEAKVELRLFAKVF